MYVYLIKCSIYYKIGFSKNPKNRLKTVKTHNPLDVDLVATIKTDEYLRLEKTLHNKFANKNSRREWFELNEDDLIHLKIDYGFNFTKQISCLVNVKSLDENTLSETKQIRIDNNKIDYVCSYFESLYNVTIGDKSIIKKCCVKYDTDIIKRAIDGLFDQDLKAVAAYNLMTKVCSNIKDMRTNPTSHVLKIINAILYKQFYGSTIHPNDVDFFKENYNVDLDHEDVVKTLNTKKFYLNKQEFLDFIFDHYMI